MKKIVLLVCVVSLVANAQIKLDIIKTLSGNSSTDQLTNIVALGDINKDSYDDFALQYYVKSDSSYAKIYFGSKPFDSTNTVVFTNPNPKYLFNSIHGGGDINGDKVKDFIVFYFDRTVMQDPPQYEMQVHFGGKPISQQPDYKIICVALLHCLINGDYNGDGFDDIIVTTLKNTYWGSIQIYFGNKSLSQSPDLVLNGKNAFARYFTMVGDINNDGYDDIIASENTSTVSYPETAFLFKGGNLLSFDNSIKFGNNGFYGYSSSLGDINGDGYKDYSIYGTNRDIFLGAEQIDPSKSFYRSKKWLFNGIGDINKDGYDDYIKYLNEYKEIHLGSSQVDTIADAVMNYTGDKYSNIGDINGDGRIEIAINDYYSSKRVNIYSVITETSVEENEQLPTEYHLSQNYPNPFNPETTIRYSIPISGHVALKVYDLLGREVAALVDEVKQQGTYNYEFSIINYQLSSGIYFYRLTTQTATITKKMMLIK